MTAFGILGPAALFLALALPVGAQALPPLADNAHVTDRLVAARVADRIRKTCPTISARLFRAYSQARALEQYARDRGYSEAEIKAFLKNPGEKKKIYARAEAYLAKNGATGGKTQAFCALGLKEIGRGTVAGSLLRAN
jgi:Family of unknown function (DUF5333)